MDSRGDRVARRGSSLLGSIKSLVARPLSWIARENHTVGEKRPGDIHLPDVDPQPAPKRQRRSSPPRRTNPVPRASSAVLPSRSRNTLSPRRPQPLPRTMSIDPPIDPLRDSSIPLSPLSPHHSFRVRSSLTPQPPFPPNRHLSEPPPLNSLISNPVFVHPPPQHHQPVQEQQTLGTLASTVRATRSPARVVSLLFEPPATILEHERVDAPAERALHQLDVYKTPLVPTRMRASGPVTPSQVPDMFKSRRASNLVLMKEDLEKEKQLEPSKPYAGQGGMKKLLARRRLELDDDERLKEQDVQTDDIEIEKPAPTPAPPPPAPASDWFAVASASTPLATSSLRVGRTKTSRNHIPRPAKKKFSAAFDVDVDDTMEDDSDKKEREAIDEASKKAPVFTLPSDFSFAKEAAAPPINSADLAKAKDPPIPSLPFSFAKPLPPNPALESLKLTPTTPPPAPEPKPTPLASIFAQPVAPAPAPPPVPTTSAGVPNFFASSKLLANPPELKVPSIVGFGGSKPLQPPAAPFSFGVTPPTPSEKPEKASTIVDVPPQLSLFGTTSAKPATSAPLSLGKPAEPVIEQPKPFNFGTPSPAPKLEEPPKQSDQSQSLFTPTPPPAQPSFASAVPPASTPSPLPFTFGAPPAASAPPPAPPSEGPKSFTFGKPDVASTPVADPPKPLFGATGTTPFSFGQDNKETKEVKSTTSPFTFGTPTAAPESKPASAFTFGTPAASTPTVAPPASIGFGFSGGTNAADVSVKPPFAFGAPPPATVERPVTPPRNLDNEVRMEESPVRETNTRSSAHTSTPFSFGAPGPVFGGSTPSSTPTSASPFTFGAPTSNPFAAKDTATKPAENGPFTFGAPAAAPPTAPPITTSFSFGKPAEERPSSGGGFTFGVTVPTPTSTTAPTSAFNFGAPPAPSNPFAQAGTSAPSSPSTFNQSSPFAFGAAPLPPVGTPGVATSGNNNPFTFGSQPASPAAGAPLSLPGPAFGSGAQPGSPFSAPIQLAPSTSGGPPSAGGGALFTIGSAPSANAGGQRPMRKLPNRRTTGKR